MKRGGPIRRRTPLRATLEQVRAWERRSRKALPVHRRGTPSELRDAALIRDGGCKMRGVAGHGCPPCWGPIDPHHVLPRGRGGPDELSNLVALCRAHHDWVHAHPDLSKPLGLLRGPSPLDWECLCGHPAGDHLPAPFLPCGLGCGCESFRRPDG